MNKIIFSWVLFLCVQLAYAELHDPARPAKYIENQPGIMSISQLDLALTLVSVDRKIVVINGQTLKIGESIGSERVEMIESNSVRLTGPSGTITLFLLDKPVKKAVP